MDNNVFFRLKNERARLGFSQSDVANETNVSLKTVQRWEKEIAIPSDKLALLVNLGFDILYVLIGQRSTTALANDEVLILEKYRQADPVTKNKMLMLLLGHNDATSSVVNQATQTGSGDQFNAKRQKIDKRNQNQTNNFHGNFGGDYVNGDKK